jgi:hypothetical protein
VLYTRWYLIWARTAYLFALGDCYWDGKLRVVSGKMHLFIYESKDLKSGDEQSAAIKFKKKIG